MTFSPNSEVVDYILPPNVEVIDGSEPFRVGSKYGFTIELADNGQDAWNALEIAQETTFGKSNIIYLDDEDSQEDDGLKIDKSERTLYFRRPSQGECWRKQKFKFRLIDVP